MKKIVLFGAGIYAEKYKSLLDFLNISVDYFSDNDKTKIGQRLYQKEVIEPIKLKNIDCRILISSTHFFEISKQLRDMEISNKLLTIEELCPLLLQKLPDYERERKCDLLQDRKIFIDIYEGNGWGGTEMWAVTVAKGLEREGKEVSLFGSKSQPPLGEDYEYLVERFSNEHTFEKMVKSMAARLPFVLINNFSGYTYMIAVMLKRIYPDQVKIISVIHNDDRKLYNAHMVFAEYVDKFLCVSDKIRATMIQQYGVEEKKVFFKEQPIIFDKGYQRFYEVERRTIRIGYAARLVKTQKRADLFPELITYLEKEGIDYELNIAGEGECKSQIEEFLLSVRLKGTVTLAGRVQKANMPEFWKYQDIFLNFSEYEGTSLSMLEAMSYACVPVVTDVSGVSEFIQDGSNGYVREVGDLKGIASAIKQLSDNRNSLQVFGERCRHEVLVRCGVEDYIDFISHTILGE